jgi:hypothetical protein
MKIFVVTLIWGFQKQNDPEIVTFFAKSDMVVKIMTWCPTANVQQKFLISDILDTIFKEMRKNRKFKLEYKFEHVFNFSRKIIIERNDNEELISKTLQCLQNLAYISMVRKFLSFIIKLRERKKTG